MKKTAMFTIFAFVMVLMMTAFVGASLAEDKLVNLPITKVYLKADKNGKPFATIVCSESRKLNGIEYVTDVVITAFGTQYDAASKLKEGDALKAIVKTREFKGNTSYQLIQMTP